MCGLLGWLGEHGAKDTERFGRALDLLAHRGPDDRGIYDSDDVLLGHRRLSILDLSASGHQPMVDPASGAVLVFNGEIYNYVELKAELEALGYRFRGDSDTEVLLFALVEWGAKALPRLNGMWTLAFWQPGSKSLLLARDRFGVKPLYYRQGARGFAFASEPKALLGLFAEHRAISETALLEFLAYNCLYTRGKSFYQGIGVFPPAHFAVIRAGDDQLKLTRYWDYPASIEARFEPERALEEFEALLDDAVRIRLRSDVPVGVTLSGGLDSTGILASAAIRVEDPMTCFTSVYGDHSGGELPWARLAAEGAKARLVPVDAVAEQWLPTLSEISWHMDGPGYSPAVYPLWHLMKRARETKVPVLLEGQGADEALAGYPQYAVLELLDYLRGNTPEPRRPGGLGTRIKALRRTFSTRWALAWLAREISPALHRWHRRRVGFQSIMRAELTLPSPEIEVEHQQARSVRDRLIEDHRNAILPGLLHYGDAMSMAHSIEARHPFMDYRLVEWMFRLPASILFHQRETKWVLRAYLRGRNQRSIADRPDKKGYPTPVGDWLATAQGREVSRWLTEPDNPLNQWCEPAKIRKLLEQNRRGAISAEHHLYKLLSTRLWISRCIEGRE